MIEALEAEIAPIEHALRRFARRQPGCRAIVEAHFGIGELTAPVLVAELGARLGFGARAGRCGSPASTSASIAPTARAGSAC